MKRITIYIAIIIAVAGIISWQVARQDSRTTADSELHLISDVYPLYSGVTWNDPQTIQMDTLSGIGIQSVPVTNVTNIAEVTSPFTEYYRNKLLAAGWQADMSREAGGPGAEISYYIKDNQFIIISFATIFHDQQPDRPVQCPCDVQFSLMSGIE